MSTHTRTQEDPEVTKNLLGALADPPKYKGYTVRQLVDLTGASESSVRRYLKKMEERGVVKKHKIDNQFIYEIDEWGLLIDKAKKGDVLEIEGYRLKKLHKTRTIPPGDKGRWHIEWYEHPSLKETFPVGTAKVIKLRKKKKKERSN